MAATERLLAARKLAGDGDRPVPTGVLVQAAWVGWYSAGATFAGADDGELGQPQRGHTWLCAPSDQPSRAIADTLLHRSGARPSAIWEFEGLTTIAQLVAQGVGVSLILALALRALDAVSITARPLQPARHRKIITMTPRSLAQDPTLAACLAALRQARF